MYTEVEHPSTSNQQKGKGGEDVMQISDSRVWTENGKGEEQICKERSVSEVSEFEQYCSWHS